MLLAAGESPTYLGPVVALLVAAGVIGYLSIRLRIVPIVGFLLAGVLIGPHQLGLIDDTGTVTAAADIGVMLLLFTIGVEFSLSRLASIKRMVLLGGGLQVLVTTAITGALVMAFGGGWRTAVFTGFLVALSSTAIVLKVLSASGRTTHTVGRASIGTLIFQDLAVVLMVLIVPLLGAGPAGGGLWDLLRALGTAAVVLTAVLLIARKVMPPLLERVARTCSPEVFLLTVVAIGLGTAYLTSLAGVSVALGAFLAGLVVSESRHSAHALGEVLPLQIIFSAVFFVSIGMLLDLEVLLRLWWLVLLLALAVVVIKMLGSAVAMAAVRVGAPAAVAGSLLLAQVGEFSFVLQRTGSEAGLSPAGLGADGEQVLIAVTVALMVATPALAAAGDLAGRWLLARRPGGTAAGTQRAGAEDDREGGVLISGWGPVAERLASTLLSRGVPVTVTTLNPDLAAAAEAGGHEVVRGDPIKENVLTEAGLRTSRLVVICENDNDEATHIATVIRQLAPGVPIVVRPRDSADALAFAPSGADHIVDTPGAVVATLATTVLRRLGLVDPDSAYPDPSVIVDFVAQPAPECPHVSEVQAVLPKTAGCTDCLRAGRHDWVHLRICLRCGHVGCCDSSPGRHASAHADSAAHPIAASAEPGQTWAWCFLDRTELQRQSPRPS
ncbi:cation:proton antiporter [Amycolatopsis palatopharyngis]|uniref:cation:proton antiporter domain-containing protein n=1 Tax=Amycolatopsis palatopharyngis TaxID=187982 RepID=UPI000E24B918